MRPLVANAVQVRAFFKNLFSVLNRTSFVTFGFLWIFFVLLNSDVFSATSEQAETIRNAITYLSIFTLVILVITGMKNAKGLEKELFNASGFRGLTAYLVSFVIFGIIFVSAEGRLDTQFVTGYLSRPSFLFTYMFVIAFLEEVIFRVGVFELLREKTKNLTVVYVVSATVFAFYHYYKYNESWGLLFFSFLAGLFFSFLKQIDNIGGFPTLPIGTALHQTYNLSVVGGLSMVLSMIGYGVV